MLKINQKLLKRIGAVTLVGTLFLSSTGCSNGVVRSALESGNYLEGKYSAGGYYLSDTSFDGLLVIEIDGKLKIVDNDLKSVYSNELYGEDECNPDTAKEVYKYLDSELIKTNELTDKDYMNLEKLINGEEVEQLNNLNKVKYNDLIIGDGKYYITTILNFEADLSEIEVFFLDGKADRIVRRLSEKYTMDVISGSFVNPVGGNIDDSNSTFNVFNLRAQGYKEFKFVPISDLFPEVIKDEFTGDEIVELYYMISGKTEEEIIKILTDYNTALKENGYAKVKK